MYGRTFNVGAGNPQSVNRLVEMLGGEVAYMPKRPGEPDCTCADISKIVTMLGWQPEVASKRAWSAWSPTSNTGGMRRCGIRRRSRGPRRRGSAISAEKQPNKEPKSMVPLTERYRHKIKTPEELRAILGPPPRSGG